MKNHQNQTTKNNNPQKQVHINKTNTVNKNVQQAAEPILNNNVINLIKKTCVRMMCKEIIKINDVNSKRTPRPYIEIETIKGVKWDWLFDTGAGLTCISTDTFRKISKDSRPIRINAIGSKATGAGGDALLPQGVYIIPMEWNGKKLCNRSKSTKIWHNLQS